MNKMLVVVFGSEVAASEGLTALKGLHNDGDITLYATSVIVKNMIGEVSVKEVSDEGPIGTGIGMLTGSIIGLLGGPAGVALGMSLGALTGMISDLHQSGIDVQFVDDVSRALLPRTVAVLADIEEDWTAPIDAQMEKLGGIVFRRLRSEVSEDQMVRESNETKAEIALLREEMKHSHEEHKATLEAKVDNKKKKLQAMNAHIKAKIEQSEQETKAKIDALEEQMKDASEHKKAKLKKREEELKARHQARQEKLKQAGKLVEEAMEI